jgi:hypothetical protein
MAQPKVIIDYTDVLEGELDNQGQAIFNSLVNNPYFTWANNEIGQLQNLVTAYGVAYEASRNGTKANTVAKDDARKARLAHLRLMALQVNLQANGDKLKLETSGFTLAKESAKVGVLPKPTGFKVKSGSNSGDFAVEVDANSSANVYLFYFTPTPASTNLNDWRLVPSNKLKANISGFTPGKQYECKCGYKGSEEVLVLNDGITIYAQ